MTLSNYIPRYTVEDYQRWEGDWELWSGVAVSMSPSPGLEHQILAGRLFRLFAEALEAGGCEHCFAVMEVDWRIALDTVLRPDLSVLCHHAPRGFIEQTPALVAEVLSPSTRQRDLLYKRELYEKLGVAYYLVADPATQDWTLWKNGASGFIEAPKGPLTLSDSCSVTLHLPALFSHQAE